MSAEDYIFEDPMESYERCMMDDSYRYNGKPAPFNPKFYPSRNEMKKRAKRLYIKRKYIRILRQTAGAILFQFDDMRAWIPRSLCIISNSNRTVRYKEWFLLHDADIWRNEHGR